MYMISFFDFIDDMFDTILLAPSASPKNVSLVSLEQAIQIDWEVSYNIDNNVNRLSTCILVLHVCTHRI